MHKRQWIEGLPSDWTPAPAWSLFGERGERSTPEAVHLTPSQAYGVVPQAEYMETTGNRVVLNLTGQDNMKAVSPGDFIIHLRSFQGGLESSGLEGKVSAAYTVLKPACEMNIRYYQYLLKSKAFIDELANLTFQLRDGQTVNYARFARMALPVPPSNKQQRIADFLDRETGEIDAMIAKMDELAGQLEARRDAVVASMMRASDAPEAQLGLFCRVKSGDGLAAEAVSKDRLDSRGIPAIGGNGRMGWTDRPNIQNPTIVIGRVGALCGNVHLVDVPAWITDNALRIESLVGFELGYLRWQLISLKLNTLANKTAQPLITGTQVSALKVHKPPVDEQKRIADHLDEVTGRIDTMLAKAAELKSLLTERRAALITAVVTGRKDVA